MPATVTTYANSLPSAESRGIVDATSREPHCTDTANGRDGRPIGDCLSDAIRHRSNLLPDEQTSCEGDCTHAGSGFRGDCFAEQKSEGPRP
jgi:hypothetical protein